MRAYEHGHRSTGFAEDARGGWRWGCECGARGGGDYLQANRSRLSHLRELDEAFDAGWKQGIEEAQAFLCRQANALQVGECRSSLNRAATDLEKLLLTEPTT